MQRPISLALFLLGALLVYEGGLLAYGIYALVLGVGIRRAKTT